MAAFIIGNIATILAVVFWLGGLGDDKFARRCRDIWKILGIIAGVCFTIWAITY